MGLTEALVSVDGFSAWYDAHARTLLRFCRADPCARPWVHSGPLAAHVRRPQRIHRADRRGRQRHRAVRRHRHRAHRRRIRGPRLRRLQLRDRQPPGQRP